MGEFGDKVEGKVKEKGGQLSGDKKTEWEGKAQGLKGDVEGAGNKMDENQPERDKPV
ncbi:MAG TPA: CsbD family protein [Candidatus Dormibacteraeota bacterium]|nr:CsbD family protein [Candidatus Dormibacteraeota bacterium]